MSNLTGLINSVVSITGHNFDPDEFTVMLFVAESSIYRDVRVSEMTATDDAFSITGRRVGVPVGLIEVKRFRLNGSGQHLEYLPENAFYDRIEYDRSGTPTFYTIEGGQFVFAPNPVGSITGMLGYLKKFDSLGSPDSSNWLLDNQFDIYLYACLAHAFSIAQDDEQAAKYKQLYDAAVEKLNLTNQMSQLQANRLRRSDPRRIP